MKIVADDALPLVSECFAPVGEVLSKAGRSITRDDLRDAEVLLVRTRTKVNADLLDGTPVRFVGSGVIGLEHVDQDYLAERGIAFASAQGCNAVSVSEYITTALLHIAHTQNMTLAGKTIGIIGLGNVGKQVLKKASALGLKPLCCDPPRQRCEGGDFVSLATAMTADIITIHTPLTTLGEDATAGMITAEMLHNLSAETILINAARGGIVDEVALEHAELAAKVVDCWVDEPDISMPLLAAADIATPHIAGHSYEGKLNGTTMIYTALCDFLGRDSAYDLSKVLPAVYPETIEVDSRNKTMQDTLYEIVSQCYDITKDDATFRLLPQTGDEKRRVFEDQRRSYPMRRQWDRIRVKSACQKTLDICAELGFQISVNKTSGGA